MSTFAPHWRNALELVSDRNFRPDRYLAANPDLRAAAREDPRFDPLAHFETFGRREKRRQLAALPRDRIANKYQRFRPVLVLDQGHFLGEDDSFPISFGAPHHDLVDYDGESANPEPAQWLDVLRNDPDGRYLDLGCGFREVVYDNCLYLEVYASHTADIITQPGASLPIRDGVLDGLGCFAVLEHVADPFHLVREITRVVRPGGRIFIDWPFLQPVHGYPSHYFNATRAGLEHAFRAGFTIDHLDTEPNQQADFTLTWILHWFVKGITAPMLRTELLRMTVRDLMQHEPQSAFYRRCLAAMSDETKMKLACGNTLIAKRRTSGGRAPEANSARLEP